MGIEDAAKHAVQSYGKGSYPRRYRDLEVLTNTRQPNMPSSMRQWKPLHICIVILTISYSATHGPYRVHESLGPLIARKTSHG
jgi:hypothetical protein